MASLLGHRRWRFLPALQGGLTEPAGKELPGRYIVDLYINALPCEDEVKAMGVADGVPAANQLSVDLARSENRLICELIAVRQRRGLKPADVARTMGVDRSVVTRFESGGTNPTMATINRYAEAVGAMIRYTVELGVATSSSGAAEA